MKKSILSVSLGLAILASSAFGATQKITCRITGKKMAKEIEPDKVARYLAELPGIEKVHDLHIWAMSTTETALTAHLVKPDGKIDDPLLDRIQKELHDRFGIEHMTVQLECGDSDHSCSQESEHVV